MSEAVATGTGDAATATAAPAEAAPATTAAPEPQATLLGGEAAPATEAKPEGEAKPAEAAPAEVEYVIELPEGAPVDEARLTSYKGALKEAGLTQDQASKLTPFLLDQMKVLHQEQLNAWADQTRTWRSAIETDQEFGGANLKTSLADAARARDAFATPEFRDLLRDPHLRLGDHPGLFKFMAAIGKAMGEDQRGLERQGAPGERDLSVSAVGKRMFPDMTV